MNLVDLFIEFAECNYSIDWAEIQRCVAARLKLTSSFDALDCNPRQRPSYWYVPLLLGNYVGASRRAVLEDTKVFVTGCIVRHFIFECDGLFDPAGDATTFRAVMDAYDACRLSADEGLEQPFEERFPAKCLPWIILLTSGTHAIFVEAGGEDYASAMRTIVRVHSCLQMIDDWHDRSEDIARSHWNMWVQEPAFKSLSVIEPLIRGSRKDVDRLRPHLLRRILNAQLYDTTRELKDVVTALSLSPK